jgi:adenosine 3'-phospho 5'-phosphosulfate transporter B2
MNANDDQNGRSQMKPLMVSGNPAVGVPNGSDDGTASQPTNSTGCACIDGMIRDNPEFFGQASKFFFCFCGLQVSYLTWGYMQELIMTTAFNPTPGAPDGMFPSAAFCVFSNRFLAVLVAMVAVKIKHGSVFGNNTAPLMAFTPCALSNTMSSWSQYASLKYVSFPMQTIFKSSKVIPVMIMGKVLKGAMYPFGQYVEAFFITLGVAVFSLSTKSSDKNTETEMIGLVFLVLYISFDSFTSQWQDKVYQKYGRANVDPYQMMLGVNTSAICITTAGLIVSGDFPVVIEFLQRNPVVFQYNVITAITSASGQLFIYYTIKEFGPIAFTIIMTTRQMISICLSAAIFGHTLNAISLIGALIVFGVLFYQIRRKYMAKKTVSAAPRSSAVESK